ncbi:MAG TPA: hypothetical protein VGW75_01430 [Solirubrobacteraceae bacterium]|nr:hypothetical protein [Solirubrobacteraceae bacterium]
MTIVISCLTERYVLQVSDRRLTQVGSGRPVPGEFNKAVLFGNSVAFAYTGLAKIGRLDTDEWLADALASGHDDNSSIVAVRDRATTAFRRLRCAPRWKAHAFVAVGWDKPPDNGGWVPWICWISNSMDAAGRWIRPPTDSFEAHSFVLRTTPDGRALALSFVGVPLTRTEHVSLMRDLKRYVNHGVGPALVAERLVSQVRQVARRATTVSEEVMVNAIPLLPEQFDSGEMVALSSRPVLDALTFIRIPAGETEGVEVGPRGAFPGGAQFFDFRARELAEPGDVEVVLGFKTPRAGEFTVGIGELGGGA